MFNEARVLDLYHKNINYVWYHNLTTSQIYFFLWHNHKSILFWLFQQIKTLQWNWHKCMQCWSFPVAMINNH